MDKNNLRLLVVDSIGKTTLMKAALKLNRRKFANEDEAADALLEVLRKDGWSDDEIEVMLDSEFGVAQKIQFKLPFGKGEKHELGRN